MTAVGFVDADPVIGIPSGLVVDTTLGAWGLATAVFSPCRTWRYRLSRVWDPIGARVNFVLLNPSTADAFALDPTVRRCVGFARAWGFGAVEVTNCFALRSTDPRRLRASASPAGADPVGPDPTGADPTGADPIGPDPIGPDNDAAVVAAARAADLVVAGWGVHAALNGRDRAVRTLLADAGVALACLRVTKDGHPRHPLYVPGTASPQPWSQPTRESAATPRC